MTNYTQFFPFPPAPEQLDAVELADKNKIMVLTGGPGVGKTATINAILQMFKSQDKSVLLCAPTGKAARRMAEQCGVEAMTIHRALAMSIDPNKRGPIASADVIIADEVSMVDTVLCSDLLTAVDAHSKVIFVGDVDQLPSIGAGRVLFDLINSGVLPVVRLTKIFRQASESRIPYVAREINEGETPNIDGTGGVRLVETPEPAGVVGAVCEMVKMLRSNDIPWRDVQVLAPQRTGDCGVTAINNALQDALNPDAERNLGIMLGDTRLCAGDRVIHIKNNYDLGLCNGEIGTVIEANWKGLQHIPQHAFVPTPNGPVPLSELKTGMSGKFTALIEYDIGGVYAYPEATASEELQMAYAITVHKSQGSQFKYTLIVVHDQHQWMLTRPLLYTAITRASEHAFLIGTMSAIDRAARNTRGIDRNTTLQERLVDVLQEETVG